MAHAHHIPEPALAEEALTVLFCLLDDAYYRINPKGRRYESLKRLSDSEVLTLALFQQLRGVESCRAFLRDAGRFLAPLFPGLVGLFGPPHCIAGCSGCGVSWNPSGAVSCRSWWATPRR